jgi:CelD/BcsL family acetyltransferase involved in cellulose biosynthesis
MDASKHLPYLGCVLPRFTMRLFGRGSDHASEGLLQDGLNTRCYQTWPDNGGLVEEWDKLVRGASGATAFHTPAWQWGIGRAFERVGRWRLIAVSLGQRLLCALPLTLTRGGVLETPGEMISDYLDPLVSGVGHATAWRSILEMVKQQGNGEAREIVLHNVRHDAPCIQSLREVSADCGFQLTEENASAASRIALPASFDDFLAALSGHDRKELRRKMRHAHEAGARLEIHNDEAQVHADLDRIFSQMREVGGVKGIKAQWMYRPLFKRTAPLLLRGRHICTYNLLLGDVPAAGLICFPSSDGPMMWAGGWNREMRQHSPGIVLFGMAIRDSIERGHKHFDLLRGQCRYKNELGAADYPLRRLTLRRAA